jgi:hypothetical protein
MSTFTRFFVDDHALQELKKETNPVKKAGMALREYIPIEVTSFYLPFFAAADNQPKDVKEFSQFLLLPILGLILTFVVSISKNIDKKSTETKFWRKTDWIAVFVSTLSFVAWVYVTGGHFHTWTMSPFIAAILFAFFSIAAPIGYGLTKR